MDSFNGIEALGLITELVNLFYQQNPIISGILLMGNNNRSQI